VPPPSDHRDASAQWQFHLGYGALCLDFANTVSWRGSEAPVEHLPSYGELIRFALQTTVVSAPEARRLERAARLRPSVASAALRRARALRDSLHRVFAGLAARRAPVPADLDVLNTVLPDALAHLRVAPVGGVVRWAWEGEPDALDRLLWPVARDAAVFLTSGALSRLRTCENPRCGWIFLDTTRSQTRRWCSMAVCGNRAKLRAFRHRVRAQRRGLPRGPRRV
jgi:predicted RNA-binding Zn ribbon-like protein